MSTRGIQYIIDNASAIDFSRQKTVGQLVTRSGRLRTAQRASTNPWQLVVTPPTYSRYEDVRDVIEGINIIDRDTYFWIDFKQSPGLNYVTEYRGELNSAQLDNLRTYQTTSTTININEITGNQGDNAGYTSTATLSTIVINGLPSIGDVISTSTVATVSAQSFSTSTSVTYNRAFNTSRTDFLIKTSDYDSYTPVITTGLALSNANVTGGQTISTITRDYTTLAGISYTRIIMSGVANSNSTAATADGSNNISTTINKTTIVSTSTVMFKAGDWIQFTTNVISSTSQVNRGFPRTVPIDVLRGSGSTISVPVSRPFIWESGKSDTLNNRAGGELAIGNDVRIGMVITKLPSWKLLPGRIVQWTGDFELYEYQPGNAGASVVIG
jgi:hypothetical protein